MKALWLPVSALIPETIAKGVVKAAQWDLDMSIARKDLDWNKQMSLAIDPKRAREVRETRNPSGSKGCAMCGKYCAMKILSKFCHWIMFINAEEDLL